MKNLLLFLVVGICAQLAPVQVSALEAKDRQLCPHEDWTRKAAISTYFRDHYYEFDLYGGAFIGAPGRSDRILSEPQEERIRVGTMRHDRVLGIIYRLGRLLPRFSHQMDLPAMIHQAKTGVVKDPSEGEYVQFLRVALVRDMLASSDDAGVTMARFLKYLDELESQTDAMRNGNTTPEQLQAYHDTLEQAEVSRKEFRAILKRAIFTPDLHDRMSARLTEFCSAAADHE